MADHESEELAETDRRSTPPEAWADDDRDRSQSDGDQDRSQSDDDRDRAQSDGDVTSAASRFEDGARSFLELEDELDDASDATRARVVDAETIPSGGVPAEYPRTIGTERALALGLAVDGSREHSTAYFAWPPGDGDELDRLLDAIDVSRSSFADLNGRRLLVTVEDGHVVPLVPPTPPRGSPYGLYGVLGGQAANLALLVGGAVGPVGPGALVLGLLLVNLVALPAATYLDASHLRTRTDFDHAPSLWALMQLVIGVNVLVTVAYLRVRQRARPLASAG